MSIIIVTATVIGGSVLLWLAYLWGYHDGMADEASDEGVVTVRMAGANARLQCGPMEQEARLHNEAFARERARRNFGNPGRIGMASSNFGEDNKNG